MFRSLLRIPILQRRRRPKIIIHRRSLAEVIGRIRDYPDQKNKPISSSAMQLNPKSQSLRVKTEIGYRNFSLDGIPLSEKEDLEGFYKKFIESRINGVKLGAKCTVMMYGPTGSGKSHTMFGCAKQSGIVHRSLKVILNLLTYYVNSPNAYGMKDIWLRLSRRERFELLKSSF
ncbi:hypothetical protein M9H77_11772 [Catharanthus roseus]|uniref:Uncharacterized protein n=1 Tax=Catharanthus roseus TaxID=4058 RepID=A0ACC0BFP2_CATRO|nr:hypothetical protein M9H77_11772 [Catharanthus roseus]